MPATLTKIWIHALFSTKNREPLIQPEFESQLRSHIISHLEREARCPVRLVNGQSDHLHLLFLLNPNRALKEVLQSIKGESSHWINAQDFLSLKFAWEKGYVAHSVSDSAIEPVELHIRRQTEYHASMTYTEECRDIMMQHHLASSPVAP
jgi:REP element-mobilizing transposase RayT